MGITLNPYLNFRGNAREAMEFYEGVFGGKLSVSTFADYHAASDPSENDLVMHADLEGSEGIRFMAADTRCDPSGVLCEKRQPTARTGRWQP